MNIVKKLKKPKNTDLVDDLMMSEEPTLITLSEKDKSVRGIFKGFTLTPWPIVLIDDGGAIYGVTMNHKIQEFLATTQIPAECVLKITWTGKTEIGGGRSVSHFKFELDNLPESYDKSKLQEFSGKRFDPSKCDPSVWEAITKAKETSRKAEDVEKDLPF